MTSVNEKDFDNALHLVRIGEVIRAMMVVEVSLGVSPRPDDKGAKRELKIFRSKFKDEHWDGRNPPPEKFLDDYTEAVNVRFENKPCSPAAA